jgi:hypothetical protein
VIYISSTHPARLKVRSAPVPTIAGASLRPGVQGPVAVQAASSPT